MRSLLVVFALAAVGAGWEWRRTTTPHFEMNHQGARLPPGFTIGAERAHSRLRMDLGLFSPWLGKERVNLYVYADQESYLEGEFKPPKWSNGLAVYERRAVAIPTMKDPRKMIAVMAHETTHLIFDGWWHEARRTPPAWINEGLAMVEEAESPDRPESSAWYRRMAAVDPRTLPPLAEFFAVTPTKDLHDEKAASDWYVQAYSVVHFLLRRHSRLQFKSLCAQLRDDKPVAKALWLTYRYRRVEDLDKKWRAWLAEPIHRRRAAAAGEEKVDESVLTRADARSASFRTFETDFTRRKAVAE